MNIIKKPLVTPPQSFISKTPPTPPLTDEKTTQAASQVVREIKRRKTGRSICNNAWEEYKLNEEEYTEIRLFLSAERLVLRMPSGVHERFIWRTVNELAKQLESIASGEGRSAEFAQGLTSDNSTTLKFEGYGKHDPDGQFAHSLAQYPGVVIEVSFSQKRKDLKRLADNYILGSDGNICAMVGIDIEYRGTKKVTLSVWQPQIIGNEDGVMELFAAQTVIDEVIRYEDGKWNESPQAGLHLQLKDFATEDVVWNYESVNEPIKDSLFIPASFMCEYLESVEAKTAMVEAKRGIVKSRKLFANKRPRASTPEEELDEDRRKKFRRELQKERERAERDDPLYEPSSPSDVESTSK
ncbi:hypothetical protein EAF04_010937 [Stromatinia cepivora]|nr:hypothetical protein EAF04_010937 [Stromatinia cepivora]